MNIDDFKPFFMDFWKTWILNNPFHLATDNNLFFFQDVTYQVFASNIDFILKVDFW